MTEPVLTDADIEALDAVQARAVLRQYRQLLAECVPCLHTGDEMPLRAVIDRAPNCLLARVARACGRY